MKECIEMQWINKKLKKKKQNLFNIKEMKKKYNLLHSNQQYHLDLEKLLNKKRKIIKIFQLLILENNYLIKQRNYKRKNNK